MASIKPTTSSPTATVVTDQQRAAARQYVDELVGDRRQTPVDEDAHFEMSLPAWYDKQLFTKAQKLFITNPYGFFVASMVGMMSIIAFPGIRRVLAHTKQSDTAQLSYRRYLATAQHGGIWATTPLVPGSRSWRSLEMVRKRHVLVSRRTAELGKGVIAQMDMAMLQFALVG